MRIVTNVINMHKMHVFLKMDVHKKILIKLLTNKKIYENIVQSINGKLLLLNEQIYLLYGHYGNACKWFIVT